MGMIPLYVFFSVITFCYAQASKSLCAFWKHICLRWSLMLPTVDYGAGSQLVCGHIIDSGGSRDDEFCTVKKRVTVYLSLGADLTLGFSILLFFVFLRR